MRDASASRSRDNRIPNDAEVKPMTNSMTMLLIYHGLPTAINRPNTPISTKPTR
ncbi:hypothetical protein [Providencia sp. Me31A]|uniref:hypothetical protein n=1 Tax=Providencia sp. Me31A TaxID=3392637 RepID=UPI003D2C5AF6